MPIADEWSGLADLLANLIEKYASDLELDDLPTPAIKKNPEISAVNVEPSAKT